MTKPSKQEVLSVIGDSYTGVSALIDKLREQGGLVDPSRKSGLAHYVARFKDIDIDSLCSTLRELVEEDAVEYLDTAFHVGYDSVGAVTDHVISYRRKQTEEDTQPSVAF